MDTTISEEIRCEEVYAAAFHTEAALVYVRRSPAEPTLLAIALAGNLRPGDELLSISGKAV